MDVEHVDALGTGKRCEADGRFVGGAEQGQRVGEPRGEGGFVVRHGRPGLLLARAVVVGGEPFDAGAEDFSQQRRVRRQERPQRKLRLYARHHHLDTLPTLARRALSPSPLAGEGRPRAARAGGGGGARRVLGVEVNSPSRFDRTSLFQNLSTKKSFAANHRSRRSSVDESACCPPSTSTTTRAV